LEVDIKQQQQQQQHDDMITEQNLSSINKIKGQLSLPPPPTTHKHKFSSDIKAALMNSISRISPMESSRKRNSNSLSLQTSNHHISSPNSKENKKNTKNPNIKTSTLIVEPDLSKLTSINETQSKNSNQDLINKPISKLLSPSQQKIKDNAPFSNLLKLAQQKTSNSSLSDLNSSSLMTPNDDKNNISLIEKEEATSEFTHFHVSFIIIVAEFLVRCKVNFIF
jgi:hypothetical protein